MKKAILFILLLASLSSYSQQQSFESFHKDSIDHPLDLEYREDGKGFQPANVDSKGKSWNCFSSEVTKGFVTLSSGNIKLSVPVSPNERIGYNYNYSLIVDENDAKIIKASGYEFNYNRSYYLIKYDINNQVSYIHSKSLSDIDTVRNYPWFDFNMINNRPLILTDKKILWDKNPGVAIPFNIMNNYYTNNRIFSDKKNILYFINYDGKEYIIYSFYADGTYERRLSNKKIKEYKFDSLSHTLTVFAIDSIYSLSNKNQVAKSLNDYNKISKSSYIYNYKKEIGDFKNDIIISPMGIIINQNNQTYSYVFNEHPELGVDTLNISKTQYEASSVNLQDDSTLAFNFYNTDTDAFLFSFKKGKFKTYPKVKIFKQPNMRYQFMGFYISNFHTYYYLYSYRNGISQVKDDTTLTLIATRNSNCRIEVNGNKTVLDKDYLWMYNYDTSSVNCEILRLQHDTYFVNGSVYYDKNSNGEKEYTEFPYSKTKIIALPSGLEITPDFNGKFGFKGEQGKIYKLLIADSLKYSSIKNNNNQIGLKLKVEKPEVASSFFLPRARCNTNVPSRFSLRNIGVVPAEKVVIKLVAKNNMQLLQNNQLVDTAVFIYSNLPVHKDTTVNYNIQWPDGEQVGEKATLHYFTELYASDASVTSMVDSIETIIRCSYDPNDKSVSPVGQGREGYVLHNTLLNYQIRFENTGNDTAYNVKIYDTLNPNLDLKTFKVVGNSHNLNTELKSNGEIVFNFNDIMLPDTNTNKALAQGYVRFSIRTKTGLQDNTVICNKAGIVFDGNKPVITNQTCNTFVSQLPQVAANSKASEIDATLYPNPSSGIFNFPQVVINYELMDAFGNVVLKSDDKILNVSNYPAGIYFVKMKMQNKSILIKKISVIK